MGSLEAYQQGRWVFAGLYIGCYLFFVGAALPAFRISLTVRSLTLIAALFVLSVSILIRIGLSGIGLELLILACALSSVLMGKKAGLVLVSIGVLAVFIIGGAMVWGILSVREEHLLTSLSPLAWGVSLFVFSMISIGLVILPQMFQERLTSSLELSEVHAEKLERSNASLRETIEARREAEDALKESEEKYRNILADIQEGYYEVDLAGNFTFVNNAMCRIMRASEDELVGSDHRKYTTPETAKKVFKAFNTIYGTGVPIKEMGWECIGGDGEIIYVETSASLIKGTNGEPKGFRGVVRDNTEKRRVEIQLKETTEILKNIFDSSIDGITTTDMNGTLTFVSKASKDILGHDFDELIAGKAHEHYAHGLEDAKKIMAALTQAGALKNHEMKFFDKTGRLVDISMSASILRDETGKPIGTLGIYRDITEKKQLESQLQQAQKMEAIGTLAGGIAHDFNNLLQVITGYTQVLLLNVNGGDFGFSKLMGIQKASERAAKLVRQLLLFGRKVEVERLRVDLNKEVEHCLKILERTIPKMVNIELHLSRPLGTVEADPVQMEQILLNLGANAADAMPEGGSLIIETGNVFLDEAYVHTHLGARAGKYVLLTVSDTGHGMDPKTVEHIFEPFYTTKDIGRGTGLGLASVYGIVKSHGGYIMCYSEVDRGTTFKIYLPVTDLSETYEAKDMESKSPKGGPETILLVDDEESIRDVARQVLREFGYTVLIARNGEEALEIHTGPANRIDLTILDLGMPGMGGYKCMREILHHCPSAKILIASGYSPVGQAKATLEAGAKGFIPKPYHLTDLLLKVRDILD